MKKRSRVHRQRRRAPHLKALELFSGRGERKRRTWTFEHLEDRHYMSATPIDLQTQSISSATPEGAAAVWAREMAWAMLASANSSSASSQPGNSATLGLNDYLLQLYALPDDPYFSYQWHLLNVGQEVGNPDYQRIYGMPGQDINVTPVWERGITGAGVTVGVIDGGIQANHPDLAANIHPTLRFGSNIVSDHGTAVAGLIAAAGNSTGGRGVAPDATLVPMEAPLNDLNLAADALLWAAQNGIDITNNSYGPVSGLSSQATNLSPAVLDALRRSVVQGRGGLGMINVFASGNSAGASYAEGFESNGFWDSAAYNAFVNSRYTIGVTGVDHDGLYYNADGTFTSYAEAGSSVLVAAPTGSYSTNVGDDAGTGSGIFTTDRTGNDGYNVAPLPSGFEVDTDYFPDPNYTSRFNGTSAAAPIVSGVVALMLQANPQLTWRDVQEILVRSARQNAQFENTWRTNQNGIFFDPDPFPVNDPPENPHPLVYTPVAWQNQGSPLFRNGAGYTVSQGYGEYRELIGYGHGVVDADLAVKMAEQWHEKGQGLGEELTYTTFVVDLPQNQGTIPGLERGNDDSGNILVPGGIGGKSGFIDYWNEYFADDPFSGDDPPNNTRGNQFLSFFVPEDQNMVVESVDVKVSIAGSSSDLDHLRIMLQSPDGTQSELIHFQMDESVDNESGRQNFSRVLNFHQNFTDTLDPDGGNFVWTFNTNRNWGERSDGATNNFGEWRLYVENWSDSEFNLDAFEIAWHGRAIGANTQRISGFINEGDNEFFENATISAYPVVNGVALSTPAAQFITGHDGNYYFDLVPGVYAIAIDNPELQDRLDPNEKPQMVTLYSSVSNVNFSLTPENPPSNTASFSGTVVADLDGNGELDGNDTGAGGVVVYVDANRNGSRQFDEVFTITSTGDADRGSYTLEIPAPQIGTAQVRLEKPSSGWTFTNPSDGKVDVVIGPGTMFSGKDFYIQPPANTPGGSGNEPGSLLGVVFNDHDGDGIRDLGDEGMAGQRVFVDSPQNGVYNGVYDVGELSAVTDSNGAYMIANVPVGTVRLDVETGDESGLTTPALGYREVVLASDGTFSNLLFGLKFLATRDFGDLPDSYDTLEASGGPWHTVVQGFQMGATIDGEVNGKPTGAANGDDLAGINDDDGVVVTSNSGRLEFGTNTLQVTLNGIGGLLNAWMDFNHDGDFNDAGEQVFTNLDRNPGTYPLTVEIPSSADLTHRVATRFRWGAPNLGVGGGTFVGEVEDYVYSTFHLSGDYNSDFEVDNLDRAIYWATFGSTTDLRADGNHNGVVDAADFVIWRANASSTSGGSAASVPGSGSAIGGSALASVGTGTFLTIDSSPIAATSANVSDELATTSTSVALPIYISDFSNGLQVSSRAAAIEPDQAVGDALTDPNLLLDQAWAAWEPSRELNGVSQITTDGSPDEVSGASDLALAAAFDDELDWRPGI